MPAETLDMNGQADPNEMDHDLSEFRDYVEHRIERGALYEYGRVPPYEEMMRGMFGQQSNVLLLWKVG